VQIDQYVDALSEQATALADAATTAGLAADVPTCPGWTVRELVGHTGGVHRWAAAILTAGLGGGRQAMPPAPVDGLLDWYREGASDLVELMLKLPDDVAAWTFLPAPTPKAFWARRQAHETAIHRADAECARGTRVSFPVEFALDGIDELMNGFLARPRTLLVADPPLSVLVAPTDADRWWHMTIDRDGRTTRSSGSLTADATVRGAASDLYLYLWNRVHPGPVDVAGDLRVTELWRGLATVQ
jgi:uncharacterized protein (TIGR03083 family)